MTRIEQEIPDQPDVERLFRAADERSAALYPGQDRAGPTIETLLAAGIRFFVARVDGQAVGCGGFVPGGENRADENWAEMKRIFVDKAARGHGIGETLVRAIEDLARNERFQTMRLETGTRAEAAIRLYHRLSYARRAPYGPYAADPSSIFMEKNLGAAAKTG